MPSVIDGYNATILSYGAAGTGKTHTMLGSSDHPGIIMRCLSQLFLDIGNHKHQEFKSKLSYLEIYNETIKDLLSSEDKNIDIREDPKTGI